MSRRVTWEGAIWTLCAVAFFWLFAAVGGRLAYPFDIEWMEGGMLLHAHRVLEGRPLYTEPCAEWAPYLYPPLYPWLLAAAGRLVGLSYTLGRSLSLLGSIAAMLALVAAVRTERGHWGLALGAAAVFATTYDDVGSFFDLVRNDGVLIGLVAWSLVCLRRGRPILGGLLLAAVFWTKHNVALLGLPMLWWSWSFRGRADAARFLAAAATPAIVLVGAVQWMTDGHFLRYLVAVPAAHPWHPERLAGALGELFRGMPLLVAALAVALLWASWRERKRHWDEGAAFWGSTGLVTLVVCMLMRAHVGGFINVLIPGFWILCVAAGVAATRVCLKRPGLRIAVAILFLIQVWQGRFEVRDHLPSPEVREAGERFLVELAQVDGDAWSPFAPWYPVLVGKRPSAPLIALWDLGHEGSPYRRQVRDLSTSWTEESWSAVLADPDQKLGFGTERVFGRTRTLTAPRTFVGWPAHPAQLRTRRD